MMERILARRTDQRGADNRRRTVGAGRRRLFSGGRLPRGAAAGTALAGAAITGGVALLVALALAVVATGRRGGRPAPRSAAGREAEVALALGQDLREDVERWFQAQKKHAVVAALAAGFAFGVSPRLRQTVRRLLGN